jgi:hypothetical protein
MRRQRKSRVSGRNLLVTMAQPTAAAWKRFFEGPVDRTAHRVDEAGELGGRRQSRR